MNKKTDEFEKSLERLEEIVDELEGGDFTLEESLAKFEEGLKLGKNCKKILDKAETRIKKLMPDEEEKDVSDEF